ncbi:DEAD/DEAH box helicase [Solirubrobacter taibaiensis]|nr:DEAD/DEAH box helicase [Solirubrobacter taibaiensis]
MSDPFDRLHPAVQHHIVNSLGWRTLRPLQLQAIDPVLDGRHALLGAPTAGGKTEAALLPLLSRMVAARWSGLSVLYVCPLRALLNNLYPRVQGYCELLGHRAGIWHGDVGDAERRRLLADPPDVLLTTPESIEAMLMSRRVESGRLFGGVQAVVVDEIHAFAGDDRGWHLLAVLARLDALSGREIQRVGLTATVGNPDWLLNWLVSGGSGEREVVLVSGEGGDLELTVDWVATEANAARIIGGLHQGEKRLVFADSRARVESLASALRSEGTTVFVSHSSLSADDRRQAERAFAETRDCVIVSTSTLELGIDVGDLDRVIQVGAPATVASVLQRLGRTGRRAGTARNCLFLATSDMELLQGLALIRLILDGWVEPLAAPAWPVNLVAQQLLARVLAEGRVGRSAWPGSLERVRTLAGLPVDLPVAVLEHMLAREIVVEDGGIVAIGRIGEQEYGRRNFMDVTSLFLTEPLLAVHWGQRALGSVDPSSLTTRDSGRATILLGGRAWGVRDVDWSRRIVWVEPVDEPGRSRWAGSGAALSIEVCHAIRSVLWGDERLAAHLTRRAATRIDEIRGEYEWVQEGRTTLVRDHVRDRSRWWTFAGGRANRAVAAQLDAAGMATTSVDDLGIGLRSRGSYDSLKRVVGGIDAPNATAPVDTRRIDTTKFGSCVPDQLLEQMLEQRETDSDGVARLIGEPLLTAHTG